MTGRKDDAGKLPWHILPWDAVAEVVAVMDYGLRKYGRDTWQGVEPERYFAATIRHLLAWRSGGVARRRKRAAASRACCVLGAVHARARGSVGVVTHAPMREWTIDAALYSGGDA